MDASVQMVAESKQQYPRSGECPVTGLVIALLILFSMMVSFMGYLMITQRSADRTIQTRVMDQAETLVRLVVTSSNSQSADMTDMATKSMDKVTDAVTTIAKSQAEFLELVTLGRELPTGPGYGDNSNNGQETKEPDPLENMPWPQNISDALRMEAEIAEQMKNPPYVPSWPQASNRQGSPSETNGSNQEGPVVIQPL